MLSELATPHIRCCLSVIPSDLIKSTVVDESLSSMNQQSCSRENQLLQLLQQNEKSTSIYIISLKISSIRCTTLLSHSNQIFKTHNVNRNLIINYPLNKSTIKCVTPCFTTCLQLYLQKGIFDNHSSLYIYLSNYWTIYVTNFQILHINAST